MTDDHRTPAPKKARVREITVGLGPVKPGGWTISLQDESSRPSRGDQAASRPAETGSGTEAQTRVGTSLDAAANQFATRVQLLLTYHREIGTVAGATSFANSLSIFALLSEMAEASRNRATADALASFSFEVLLEDDAGSVRRFSAGGPIYEPYHAEAIANRMKYHDAALRLLHETSVQQLVNSYERLIGDIARSYILEDTRTAANDQTLTYRQILEFGTLDEVKRAVVEAQVTTLIRNSNSSEQLKWLRERLNVDVRSQFPDINAFSGLELRRHAIVHAGGIATSEYLRRLRALGESESAPEGTPLALTSGYIEGAWDVVYALGVVTVHLASVARARRLHDAEQEEIADGRLNQAAFWAIEQRRYKAAERILEYAHKRRLSKATQQLMTIVNLAQTYKWQGRETDCRDLLREPDWEAANDQFRLCAAVLRDEDAEEHLTRAVKSGDISLAHLYEWPVFSKFRESDEFPAVIERVFGPDVRPPLERFPAALLDFSHEDTIRQLFEHLEGLKGVATEKDHPSDDGDDETVH